MAGSRSDGRRRDVSGGARSLPPSVDVPCVALLPLLLAGLQDPQERVAGGYGDPRPRLSYVESSEGLQNPGWEGGATELELGDVDGDGHLDILSIGDHGSPFVNTSEHGIMTYFGDGRGNWAVQQNGEFGYGGIAIGDVNNDGFLDVGYGMHHNYSGNDLGDQLLEVALGDGSGVGWTPWDDGLATNGETWGMFATDFADVDNDGLLDVGSNSFGCCAGVHVYLNNGDGSWTQSFGFLGGNATAFLVFGDVDGDGNADLAAQNSLGNVWRGDGAGGFTNIDGNLPGTAMSRAGLDLGDVDGDGDDEIAFVLSGGRVDVWTHQSGETWTDLSAGLPSSSVVRIVQLADMDADGHLDLAGIGGGRLLVWRGDGEGGWSPELLFDLGAAGTPEAFRTGADVDHNGRPDFVFLQDQSCGAFCSRNQLYAFCEAAPALVLRPFLASPRGGGTWKAGSVRTIEWYCSVPGPEPGRVKAQLSVTGKRGPWITLADDEPNDGQLQIVVPQGLSTNDAYVRVIVRAGGLEVAARSPRPFRIQS